MNIKLDLYIDGYSTQKALLWGNFIDHCNKVRTTTGWNRTFHLLIAIAEAAPIISQIVSIFENIIVKNINPNGLLPNKKTTSAEKKIKKTKSNLEDKCLPKILGKNNDLKIADNKPTIHVDQSSISHLNTTEQVTKQETISENLSSSSDHIHQPHLPKILTPTPQQDFIEDSKVNSITQNPPKENKNRLNLERLLNSNTPLAIKTTLLNEKELQLINNYYTENLTELENQTEPLHIRKDKKNQLPRSLVYIPNGPRAGMYILLKTKNKVKEIGRGGMCRLTYAFHLDSGTLRAFRSARTKDISKREMKINKLLHNRSESFVAGVAVTYRGTWRRRGHETKKIDKTSIPQKKDVKKTAFIMDVLEGGDLFDYKYEKKLENDPSEGIRLGKEIAKTIDALHKEDLVHHDLKPENIILTKDRKPKLGDFGLTFKKNSDIPCCGTPNYLAPELWKNEPLKSNPAVDIWGFGCILAFLKDANYTKTEWWHTERVSQVAFEKIKPIYLKNRNNPTSLDYIIDQCLQWDPEKRPTSTTILNMFKAVKTY